MNRLLRLFICVGILCARTAAHAQAPVANFTSNIQSSCAPALIQFTDLSTGNPTSWNWDLGNGTNSVIRNPSTTYLTPGTYTVILTASNASGSNTKTSINYITIYPPPTVAFYSPDTALSCAPKTVSFVNQSIPNSSGTTTYFWDFGDGSTSNAQNPTHTYTASGNFTVSLIVTNGSGCISVLNKTQYIKIAPKPTASFTATNNNSCTGPITVTFNNTTTSATIYQWFFGDGGTSTATSPTHTYTAPGSYTVTLIARNGGGCPDTLVVPAAVNIGNLTAGFTNPAQACAGASVPFTNTTTPGAGTSTWYFGDGGTSTATNPTHVYTSPGTYTVKLVSNYSNCSDSITHNITIIPKPTTSFSGTPLTSCSIPHTVNFTSTSTGATSYLWNFGDGSSTATSTLQNPSHTYTFFGNYTVTLITTNASGCTDTLIIPNYVQLTEIAGGFTTSGNSGCLPYTVQFTSTATSISPITSYQWTFGDGGTSTTPNPSHTYTTLGTFTATLTVTTASGCSKTFTTTISTSTRPTAGFTAAPTTVCVGQNVTFTNTSTNATSYLWLFGDGTSSASTNSSFNISYAAPGVYTVTLIAYNNNACSDTLIRTAYITVNNPLANFTTAPSCTNRRFYTFTNTSVGATSYTWDFGDGTPTSNAVNPTHTYAANGTYTVTLTAFNSGTGCTSVKTFTIRVFAIDANFTADTTRICRGQSVTFTATSPNTYNQYVWNFGDGFTQTTSVNTVTHIYGQPGTYTVSLTLSDNGCTDSVRKVNYVSVGGSDINFDGIPRSGCAPLLVNFQDISNSPLTIVTRTWTFGDGSTANAAGTTTQHTYNAAGSYNVTLTLTDVNGCTASYMKPAFINVTKPTAAFTSADTSACVGRSVSFTTQSTGVAPLTYNWSFGDGGTSNVANPTHAYTANGTYDVRLIVTDANGCKDTLTKLAYIRVIGATAGFTMSDSVTFCPPLSVVFTNTSSNAVSYFWDFGNGNTSTAVNPTNIFTAPGTFIVTLKAYNANGCMDTFRRTVRIQQGPMGTFTYSPTSGCLPITVNFTATSTNTTSITWDFNNGVTQTTSGNTVSYTYTQPGVFVPRVIFSNNNGCSTSVVGVDTIKVNRVFAGFTAVPNPVCVGVPVQFTDTSKTVVGTVTTRSWSFGDGGNSTAANPTHSYATAGTYTVRLIAGTVGSCVDTSFRTVIVNPLPVVTAANDSFCVGGSVTLRATGASSYSWSPATGLSCTNCANPIANPATTTTYTITGTSAAGCQATGQVTVKVNPLPTVSAGPNVAVCNGNSTTLQATGAATYSWSPATGLSCTNCANPTASPATTTTYTVTGTSAAGCTNTAQVTVSVVTLPVVTVTPNQSICAGASASLQASGAATYTWTPATGLSCTNCANPTATPATTTTYTVTGSAGSGCSATAQTTVTVNPLPVIGAGNSRTICEGDSTTLTGTGGTSYTWTPATGLSCTNCANPIAKPITTTTYTVTGTNAANCSNTATVTINVNPKPNVTAGANQSICNGSTAQLQATGAVSYIWSPATGLSNTTIANPVASPTVTTTYTVVGTNANGCSDTGIVTVTVGSLPTVSAGPNQFMCPGGSVTLNGSGATSYSWSPATGLSCTNCTSPTASPATTTTYTVTGTGANGCTGTAQVTVTVNTTPVITVAGNNPICVGNSVALTAGGATSYTWTPATGLSCTNCNNPTANPTTTTTYTVTGTSGVGCTASTTVTVVVNPLPTVSAGSNVAICSGNSTVLQATGATSYTWTPATGLSCTNCANPTANPTTTTTYTVTGTNSNNCSNTATVTVTVNPKPTITTANQSICPGGSANLQANGGTSYVWSPATGLSCTNCANPVASPATTTTYTVTGTGANGCTNTATATVTVNPVPVVTVSGNTSICLGVGSPLTASGAASYTWTPATGLSCTNCANPTANPTTTTTYTVTGTSGVGCSAATQVTVTVHTPPNVTASNNVSTCAGTAVSLQGSGAATYVWSPATGLSCTACTVTSANPINTTTYVVTGTDAFGCTDTGMVTVNVLPLPVVVASPDTSICQLTPVQLQVSGADSYVWSPATGLSCTTCNNPVASSSATTTYTVTGTSTNGCTNTDQVTVTLYAQPPVNAGPDQTICFGQSAQLQASGAVSYVWSPAASLTCTTCPNPLANPASDASYMVIGTDVHGCVDSDRVAITVIQRGPISVGPGGDICAGESFQLSATGGTSYSWSPAAGLSGTTIPNPVATPSATTTYTVTIHQGQCFTDDLPVTVTVHPLPTVNAGPDRNIVAGSSTVIQTTSTDVQTYAWTPAAGLSCTNCANPTAAPQKTTTYTVNVESEFGCKAKDDITLFVTCDATQLWLPNTFTPNGDGQNDRFYPHGKGITTVTRFRIYDRWGELIYDVANMPVDDASYGWDGTYKDRQLKPDVYVYIISAQCSTGEPLEIKGDISLIR